MQYNHKLAPKIGLKAKPPDYNRPSQKKTIRMTNFSSFFEHTNPLFKDLNDIKLFDDVTFHIVVFMYKFKIQPSSYWLMFFVLSISLKKKTHNNNNTRLSSRITYALSKTRTNYGVFNTGYQGAKIWNAISDKIKP